jgi:hypothetical protein
MTHTLHRRTGFNGDSEDFVILCMAAQKYNDKGAGEKLKKIFKMVSDSNPDNLADDNLGGRYTGYTDEEILEHMGDKAYVGAAFSSRSLLKEALKKIKVADLGMSVVVSGNYKLVFDILKEIGLKPHTANMSLGIFGNKDILPKEEVLGISTMCGHGMVSIRRIENVIEMVKTGKLSPEEGGKRLASTCTCGIFNPKLAWKILMKYQAERR